MNNNNKNKKFGKVKIIIGIVVISAFIYFNFFHSNFSMDAAVAAAKDYAPKDTVMVKTDEDNDSYDITFANEDYSKEYEFEVDKSKKGITQIELSNESDKGSRIITISSDQAKKIIENKFDNLKSVNVHLDRDDGLNTYEVSFKSSKFHGEAEINPETGNIMDMSIEYLKNSTLSDKDFDFEKVFVEDSKIEKQDKNSNKGSKSSQEITINKAKSLVLDKLPGATIVELEYDIEHGRNIYDGEAVKDSYEYNFEIDAKTGEFIQWHKDLID